MQELKNEYASTYMIFTDGDGRLGSILGNCGGFMDEHRSLAEIWAVGGSLYACEDSTCAMRG